MNNRVGIKQGKAWGWTMCIYESDFVEAWAIHIESSAFCSEHHHDHRLNRFYVSRGTLEVLAWNGGEPDVTVVWPGDIVDVPAGIWHQFRSRDVVDAIELYWPDFDPRHDIQRRSIGGVDVPSLAPILTGIRILGVADDGQPIDGGAG